jgi:hypothetical protein
MTAAVTFGEISWSYLPFGQFWGKRLAHLILWKVAVWFDEAMNKAAVLKC